LETRTKIEEMAQALQDRYAAPTKAQAVNYLLMIYPDAHVNNCIIAYNLAFEK